MTESQNTPPPATTREPPTPGGGDDERFVLKAFLALFVLAGLVIAVLTIFGGGIGGD